MATYYGYQEREDPTKSMIDWAGITKDITDGIYAENKRREEEKFTLDENYIKQLNELNEYSQGLNPSVNQAMLGYIQNYRDYLLQNHKMMKQGIISVNDSKLAKQGAQDSFNNLNNVVKGVNGKLEELQKAGGALNDDQMKDLTQLMEFKDQQLLIDPKTGMASLARRNEDGTVDKNSIVPVGAAYQMFTPYEQKSVNDMVQGEIKGLAQWTEADSPYKSISDLRDNKDYKGWMDGTLEVMMADQRTTASLGASLGLLKSGELVKKNSGGVITYELTDTGRDKVKEALRQAIEVRVDREVKMKESIHQRQQGTAKARTAEEVYNESYDLSEFNPSTMNKLNGRKISRTVDGKTTTVVLGPALKDGNDLVIVDQNNRPIERITIDPNNPDSARRLIAGYVNSGDIAATEGLWKQGRSTGYSGDPFEPAESSEFIDKYEIMPSDPKGAVGFLRREPAIANSDVIEVNTSGLFNNGVEIIDKINKKVIGRYFIGNNPEQKKQFIEKLKEYGIDIGRIPTPPELQNRTKSEGDESTETNKTTSVTGGNARQVQ
jgi:hypothetical protein